jgi:hypothetical protein
MTTKQKQAIAGAILAALAGIVAAFAGTDKPADGCQPCDCSGAVVALPGDATALAADASAVTAVAK